MNHVKNLIKNLKPKEEAFIYEFHCLKEEFKCDDQDRKHIRIMAILQLAQKREDLDNVMKHRISESFKVDEENRVVYYKIRILKERRTYRGDC